MELIEFIGELLKEAGSEAKRRFELGSQQVSKKADSSLVTEADLFLENLIKTSINNAFPSDLFVGEESGHSSLSRVSGQRVWIVDPLDGTTNFANGYPFFSVSIALAVIDGIKLNVIAGGVMDPMRGKLYVAAKGKGSFVNGKRIQVRSERAFEDSFLVTGFYYQQAEELRGEVQKFLLVANKCQSVRRDGSAALDLALVAEGIYDGFWEKGLAIWDVAAGSLLVSEAGGCVVNYQNTNIDNNNKLLDFNLETPGIVAGRAGAVKSIQDILAQI